MCFCELDATGVQTLKGTREKQTMTVPKHFQGKKKVLKTPRYLSILFSRMEILYLCYSFLCSPSAAEPGI